MTICIDCGTRAAKRSGRCGRCRYQREKQTPEDLRRTMLRIRYGVTPEEFDAKLTEQGGRCAICRADNPRGGRHWHVDHDHDTGRFRGVLCLRCNTALGTLGDSPDALRSVIAYLEAA